MSDPYRLDVTRTPSAHVAFGHGVHRCIGAPLAKLEPERLTSAIVRFPVNEVALRRRNPRPRLVAILRSHRSISGVFASLASRL